MSTAFLFYFESRDSDFDFSNIHFGFLSIIYLLLALLMMVFRDFAYMLRIRLLTDKFLSWKKSFSVIMLWEFASALTPGVVGGSAIAIFILKKEKIHLGKATSIVLLTAIMDNLFYLICLPLVFLLIPTELLFPNDINYFDGHLLDMIWIAYSIIFGTTFILLSSLFFFPALIEHSFKLIYRFPYLNRRKEKGEKIAKDMIEASKEIRSRPLTYWLKILMITFFSWTSRFLVINFLLLAFIEVGLFEQVVVFGRQILMWVILLISPTPGGSGVAEYLFSNFLADIINHSGLAISLAFLWRLISYYPYLIIGSIILPPWLRK